MEKIKTEKKLCLICMEKHEVDTVQVIDKEIFKDEEVEFNAVYEYCSHADEYLETEDMNRMNSLAMKDAYRKKLGLLTSDEIINIRKKYNISQKDFSKILRWGGATITRYENHQVQDSVHDDVLRKISNDAQWFLEMLDRSKNTITPKTYKKYCDTAKSEYKRQQNQSHIDSIKSTYTEYDDEITGEVELNLEKVTDVINYLALKVKDLHKVKLMKMLWYSDNLHFKRNGAAITGLAYVALPMGAVPEGHDEIIELDNIDYDIMGYSRGFGFKFKPIENFEIKSLNEFEIETLDSIIEKLGALNTDEIVATMHEEDAYKHTNKNSIIKFSFAENLSID